MRNVIPSDVPQFTFQLPGRSIDEKNDPQLLQFHFMGKTSAEKKEGMPVMENIVVERISENTEQKKFNSRILPLLGPTLILPGVQMDPRIILHYYSVGTQILYSLPAISSCSNLK